MTFSVLPYGVNIPKVHFKEDSPCLIGSLKGNEEGQVMLATEMTRDNFISSQPLLRSFIHKTLSASVIIKKVMNS